MTTFGSRLKAARIDKGITLRKFCLMNQIDPGNQSKYERDILPPPTDPEVIVRWLMWMGYPRNHSEICFVLLAAERFHVDRIKDAFGAALWPEEKPAHYERLGACDG